MNLFLVGIGGFFGALTRFQLGKMISKSSKTGFPVGTFFVNLTGAFLLGVVSSCGMDKNVYLVLGDGFLGAYTTFSTFMYEGFRLYQKNDRINVFLYIFMTLSLGIIGYLIGFAITAAVTL
ncbi:fluoride efflux transporter CrcB [Sinanaerobacter sp. ZZT-01]|uniref:fluoride efflux transporter CrcB n=1 Tax=Sinanaerobacter sp. ZZT-01 TaxID=3111540 RepID=UPI002D77B269|nr:fluoride efflux transporter CrcB [Sinanaerobacter sp. ZZT-01]WRR94499.1 fluoride efflux transporter CrcB [Sinanaerobacter sp. ZZT-01]